MDNAGAIIGIFVGIAISFTLFNNRGGKIAKFTGVLLVVISAAVGSFFSKDRFTANKLSDMEQALDYIYRYPFVGIILRDHPEELSDLKATFQIFSSDPIKVFDFGAKLRQKYFPPTVMAADDVLIETAWLQSTQFANYLHKNDFQLCVEFGFEGIKNAGDLKGDTKKHFEMILKGLEEIYNNGKSRAITHTVLTPEEFKEIFMTIDFTVEELMSFGKEASQQIKSNAIVRLYNGVNKLPEKHRLNMMRSLLAEG